MYANEPEMASRWEKKEKQSEADELSEEQLEEKKIKEDHIMKITKRQLKRIIREEGYYSKLPQGHVDGQPWAGSLEDLAYHQGRTWGHGEVVDQQGFKGNIQKSKKLATGRDGSPLQMSEAQLKKIIHEYHPRPDDDYDPLDTDEFAPPTPEEDAEYDRGYDDGFNGYPQAEDGGLGYYAGYEEGENDAKDPDSEASREHAEEFGPGSPGMMGPSRRESVTKITKRQLRQIIKEEMKLAGGMGNVPVPDPDLYDLGKDDGSAEEGPDPVWSDNASYMKGYEDGKNEILGGRG